MSTFEDPASSRPTTLESQCRRRLLLAAGAALAAPAMSAAATQSASREERLQHFLRERRSLWLVRGDEQLRATYWTAASGYDQDQYLAACWALRDLRANRVFSMDRALLDVLAALQAWLAANGIDAPLRIHSAYRTGRTNRAIEGAALDSRHVQGKAVDITVAGVSNVRLAGMASVLARGGTGFYPGRNFVHVDTGEERMWIGRPRTAG
jgi:uncharacterized protein YcbK (DUF882 family)